MKGVILVLLLVEFVPLDMGLTGLVSAVDVDFDCPAKLCVAGGGW